MIEIRSAKAPKNETVVINPRNSPISPMKNYSSPVPVIHAFTFPANINAIIMAMTKRIQYGSHETEMKKAIRMKPKIMDGKGFPLLHIAHGRRNMKRTNPHTKSCDANNGIPKAFETLWGISRKLNEFEGSAKHGEIKLHT